MRAINKYLLAKKVKEEAVTSGGLLMSQAEASEFRYQIGIVVTPGTMVEHIKEGDTIYFDKVHAFDVKIDGEMFTVIQEKDIVVVL